MGLAGRAKEQLGTFPVAALKALLDCMEDRSAFKALLCCCIAYALTEASIDEPTSPCLDCLLQRPERQNDAIIAVSCSDQRVRLAAMNGIVDVTTQGDLPIISAVAERCVTMWA